MPLTAAHIVGLVVVYGSWQSGDAQNSSLVVGTVLFTNADVAKDCWTQDSIALLTSRMLMSHLMPPPDKMKPDDDGFVSDIIDYFRLVLEVVRANASGRVKHLLLMAVADAMGGYMRHLILPVSKYSYYAGHIQYASIVRLYQLYDELKSFLRTNGDGWAKPWRGAGKHIHAKALPLQAPSPTSDPCRGIIFSTTIPADSKSTRSSESDPANKPTCRFDVPLPFFDSKSHPAAIAVPFRTFGLRNLEARVSAYILVKYYVAVSKCMAARHTNEEDVKRFNSNIYAFVSAKVMPHLGDEKFYAAFGGVLRVLQTVEDLSKHGGGNNMANINIMPGMLDREPDDMQNADEEVESSALKCSEKRSRNNMILLAILSTITIWFCLGAAFVCCRIKANRQKGARGGKEEDGACREGTCPALQAPATEQYSTTTDMDATQTRMLYSIQKIQPRSSKSSKKSTHSSSKTTSKSTPSEGETRSPPTATRSASRTHTFSHAHSLSQVPESPTVKPTESGSSGYREKLRAEDDEEDEEEVYTDSRVAREDRVREKKPGTVKDSGTTTSSAHKPPQIQVHSVQYYPPSFACHTSMTGKVRMDSSTEEYTSRDDAKRPFVFGYDFQTTSEDSTPRDRTTDGEAEMGNMSK